MREIVVILGGLVVNWVSNKVNATVGTGLTAAYVIILYWQLVRSRAFKKFVSVRGGICMYFVSFVIGGILAVGVTWLSQHRVGATNDSTELAQNASKENPTVSDRSSPGVKQEPKMLQKIEEKIPQKAPTNTNNEKTQAQPTGVNIQQHNVNGPNVVNGNVTINNPPVNPNAGTVTYDFNGGQRLTGAGYSKLVVGETATKFRELKKIHDNGDWKLLVEECNKVIQKVPEWLTPYYFKAIALANLGELAEATALLEHVDKQTQGNPKFDDARRILKLIRERNNPQ